MVGRYSHRWLTGRCRGLALPLGLLAAGVALAEPTAPLPAPMLAAAPDAARPNVPTEEQYSLHFQTTVAGQAHPGFFAAYSGQNSLSASAEEATSIVSDLWAAARLWQGASVCFQPELAGGLGLSSTLGVADFPSGEVYRVGDPEPTVIVGRAFLRQRIRLSGGDLQAESGPCELAGLRPKNSLTLVAGRINSPDYFDNNPVSDDPHTRFTSWGLWASTGYDYPADTRGYTYGLVADLTVDWWSLRGGILAEPLYANAMQMDLDLLRSNGLVAEGEGRYTVRGKPGAARLLVFVNTARMGSYAQLLSDPGAYGDDITATRQFGRHKYGFAGSANQDLGGGRSAFARISYNDGATESWAFTEVDRSLAAGVVQLGTPWQRPSDALGVAAVGSLISNLHRDYLASGGYGFIIGDGALTHYGPELLGEVFYQAQLTPDLSAGLDYQPIVNPAYNRDRGPVNVFMVRIQAAF
ncbi:MAG: carbohydrate porin [Deltaproteobacteria bacterium]